MTANNKGFGQAGVTTNLAPATWSTSDEKFVGDSTGTFTPDQGGDWLLIHEQLVYEGTSYIQVGTSAGLNDVFDSEGSTEFELNPSRDIIRVILPALEAGTEYHITTGFSADLDAERREWCVRTPFFRTPEINVSYRPLLTGPTFSFFDDIDDDFQQSLVTLESVGVTTVTYGAFNNQQTLMLQDGEVMLFTVSGVRGWQPYITAGESTTVAASPSGLHRLHLHRPDPAVDTINALGDINTIEAATGTNVNIGYDLAQLFIDHPESELQVEFVDNTTGISWGWSVPVPLRSLVDAIDRNQPLHFYNDKFDNDWIRVTVTDLAGGILNFVDQGRDMAYRATAIHTYLEPQERRVELFNSPLASNVVGTLNTTWADVAGEYESLQISMLTSTGVLYSDAVHLADFADNQYLFLSFNSVLHATIGSPADRLEFANGEFRFVTTSNATNAANLRIWGVRSDNAIALANGQAVTSQSGKFAGLFDDFNLLPTLTAADVNAWARALNPIIFAGGGGTDRPAGLWFWDGTDWQILSADA